MNELIKFNDQFYGAPAGLLIMGFAIALGYLLKTLPVVNNRYIPLMVVCVCTIGFMVIAPSRTEDIPLRVYLGRNFLVGFILGFGAWALHAQLLRRFVDPHIFNDDGSTKFFSKPPPSAPN